MTLRVIKRQCNWISVIDIKECAKKKYISVELKIAYKNKFTENHLSSSFITEPNHFAAIKSYILIMTLFFKKKD